MGTPLQDDPRYVWHAPDGLRARAAAGLGCMQAGTEKLGVIEASYASAIIGVVDRPLFRRGGTTQPKGLISTAWASISTEVWIESASWVQTARNSERSSSRRCKCVYTLSFGGEIRCQGGNPVSVHHSCPKRRTDIAPRSSGKGDSWKLETFQMEPCG